MGWISKLKANYVSGTRAARSLKLIEKILNAKLSNSERQIFLDYCSRDNIPAILKDQDVVLMFLFDHLSGQNGCPKMPSSNATRAIDCILIAIERGIIHTRPLETTEEMLENINSWRQLI